MSMEQREAVERFDELFERMSGRGDPAHKAVEGFESQRGMKESNTQIIKEEKLGEEVVRFALFGSETLSQETGKTLYQPSITAFTNVLGESLHVKRHQLEAEPQSEQERGRKAKVVAKLDEIEKLFSEYEESS